MIEEIIYRLRFTKEEERNRLWQVLTKDFFQNFIGKNDTVLDLASGYCEFINNIKCKEKIAVDVNKDSKIHAGKNVKFYLANSTKLPLKDQTVNKIFISNFFEHLTKEDTLRTVRECYRVLKPKGQVLILQPNIRFLSRDFWMFFDHITPIDDRALEEIFRINKFSLKKLILKFLPFSTQSSYPSNTFLVKLYLKLPFIWWVFGKQSFFVFEK